MWWCTAAVGLVLAAGMCCGLGCATWSGSERRLRLPTPQLPADSILWEVAFVQWNARSSDGDQKLWQLADEQFLPLDVRQRLEDNGLRVGLLSGPLPQEVMEKLSSKRDVAAGLMAEKLPPGSEMLFRRESRQCRFGISELIEVLPEMSRTGVIMLYDQGRVKAWERERLRGFFAVTAHAHTEGRLRLELVPGIEFGEPKPRVTGNAAMMRYEVQRDQSLFETLACSALVRPGQTLVLTSTPESKGLGATFFANRFPTQGDQLLMLLRVARVPDDLFGSPEQREPLVTPIE